MYDNINELLRNAFYHHPSVSDCLQETERKVLNRTLTSFVAAKQLLDKFLK
jgi:LAO/AO transport system kinase